MNELYRARSLLFPTAFGNPRLVNAVSFAILLLLGWLDYITGYEFGFFIFYFIPVSISAWYCGRKSGLVIAVASALCWYVSDLSTHHAYSRAYFVYWEMFMRLISFLTTALTLSRIRAFVLSEERLQQELAAAREEIEELKELLADRKL